MAAAPRRECEEELCRRFSGLHVDEERNNNSSTEHRVADWPADHIALRLIVARLPIRMLPRLRLVSSSWNALFGSRQFLEELYAEQARPADSWIVMARPGITQHRSGSWFFVPKELIAFCPRLQSWFDLRIDTLHPHIAARFLGPGFLRVPLNNVVETFPVLSSLTMATCGGLICCLLTETLYPPPPTYMRTPYYALDDEQYDRASKNLSSDNVSLLVFNPLTGISKLLASPPPTLWSVLNPPPPPMTPASPILSSDFIVNMLPDASAPGCYFVLLDYCVHYDFRFEIFLIYSSKTQQWKQGKPGPPFADPLSSAFEDVVNADLFWYGYETFLSPSHNVIKAGRLSGYNVQADTWSSIRIFPRLVHSPSTHVFKWRMQVYCASPFTLCHSSIDHRVAVHGFEVRQLMRSQNDGGHWKEVARTPPNHSWLMSPFPQPDPLCVHICFTQCDNLLCMSGYYPTGRQLSFEGMYYRPLVYDLITGSWCRLPMPSFGTSSCYGLGFLTLQPHLLATP